MKRILAVDDLGYNLELLQETFSNEAFHVLGSQNDIGIDLIFLDLAMPIMDGFEVLTKIKLNQTLALIPIIVITANPDEKLKALALGASNFIAKPYDILELKLRATNYIHIGQYQRYMNKRNDYLEESTKEP